MAERGISTTRVIDAVRRADKRYAAQGGAIAVEKSFGAKRLRVICRERKKGEYVIITAYYL